VAAQRLTASEIVRKHGRRAGPLVAVRYFARADANRRAPGARRCMKPPLPARSG
jgi:hypothetical protein